MNTLYVFGVMIFWLALWGAIGAIGYCGVNTWQFWVITLLIVFGRPLINSLKTK
jgi:membrane protein required for beta-lactamase induction